MSPRSWSYRRWKRGIDLGVSVLGGVVLAPVMGLVAVAVRRNLGSPVLFRQKRPGLGGEPFELVKFRTMKEGDGSDAERLTRFGRFLRSTSLDELPELWNIARGEMSLVGPRPLLMEYLPAYTDRQARRHEVRPGLTGLAQVSGRNDLTWEDRFELDVDYVDNVSLMTDVRIIAKTVASVVARRGVSAEGEATVAPFVDLGVGSGAGRNGHLRARSGSTSDDPTGQPAWGIE